MWFLKSHQVPQEFLRVKTQETELSPVSFLKEAMPSAGGKFKHGEDRTIWSASSLPLTWPMRSQSHARQLSYLLCPSSAPGGWRKGCHFENLNMRDTKRGGGREKTKQRIKLFFLEKSRKVEFNTWGKCSREGKKMGEEGRKRKWLVVKLKRRERLHSK